MHDLSVIVTLTGALAVAVVCGWITQRIGLSTLVGYMLAGIIVGPHTTGFVADARLASQMAEIGVILLMFGVGMHFHPGELLRVWRIAVPGAVAQSAVELAIAMGKAAVFAALFFVSVGMLFNPHFALAQPLLVLAALGIVLIVKPLVALGVASQRDGRPIWPWPARAPLPATMKNGAAEGAVFRWCRVRRGIRWRRR